MGGGKRLEDRTRRSRWETCSARPPELVAELGQTRVARNPDTFFWDIEPAGLHASSCPTPTGLDWTSVPWPSFYFYEEDPGDVEAALGASRCLTGTIARCDPVALKGRDRGTKDFLVAWGEILTAVGAEAKGADGLTP